MIKVELGDEVKCLITGLKGIAVSHAKCLTGCDRIEVRPQSSAKDSEIIKESWWVDLTALKIIKKAKVILPEEKKLRKKKSVGGPPSQGSCK